LILQVLCDAWSCMHSLTALQHLDYHSADFVTAVCCFGLHAESENALTALQDLKLAEAASLSIGLDFGHCTRLEIAKFAGPGK